MFSHNNSDIYTCRITVILKVETDIIANISVSLIGRTWIFVIMSVEAFRTDVTVFIGDVIMCSTSDWSIQLSMQVTNLHYIFVDQSQFSDPTFINSTHQRENVQFANIYRITSILKIKTDIITKYHSESWTPSDTTYNVLSRPSHRMLSFLSGVT